MLWEGVKLEAPGPAVPTGVTVWQWLFDQHSASTFNPGKTSGFRDAVSNEFLSFTTIKSLATYLSTAISQRFDITAGSHVSIFCSNSIWYPIVMLSMVRLGAIVTASSPEYGVEEMTHILKSSESDLVYADSGSWEVVCKAAQKVGLKKGRVVLLGSEAEGRSQSGKVTVQSLIHEAKLKGENVQVSAWKLSEGQSNKDVPSYLSYTSGTTSSPKGVMISHHNVIAQIMQMRSLSFDHCPGTMLAVLPLYHITGIIQILQLPIVLNQEVVMMSKFNMREMLDVIVKYKCKELWLVPPLLIRLVNDPVAVGYDLDFVQQFNTGAAPLAQEIIDKLAKRFKQARIRQAWGMTESTSALTLTPPANQTYDKAHTVGKVVPDTVIKIIDPEYEGEGERLLGVGESGEVLAKGPQVTMGYHNRPEATAETYDNDGFLHTGDIGFMDENGFLMIHDRLKEMIKVKGVAVAPAELEDLLLGHPLVSDVAVIGLPDDYAGEVPKAFVVLNDPGKASSATVQQILQFVRERKSRPKWLAGGVTFQQTIPKSASGKVLRRVLRDQEKERAKQNKGPRAKL